MRASNKFVLILVLASTLALAGCGGGSGGGDGDSGSVAPSETASTGTGGGTGASTGDSSSSASGESKGKGSSTGKSSDDGSSSDAAGDDATGSPGNATSGGDSSQTYQIGASIVTVHVQRDSATSSENVPVTFGQVFAQGDVPKNQTVIATIAGQAVTTQVDKKATWSDGSMRHAVLTISSDAFGNATDVPVTLHVAPAGDAEQSPITMDALTGSDFDATVDLTVNGQQFHASARDALKQIEQGGTCPAWGNVSCKQWLQGPLASEWIIPATLSSGNDTAPRLRVFFNVRALGEGDGNVTNVRVDTVIENDLAYGANPQDTTYDALLQAGEDSFAAKAVTHYLNSRWHHVLWTQGAPGVYVKTDIQYLQASKAISKYAAVTPDNKFLNSRSASFAPMTNGDQSATMGRTGAQPAIGPLPQWTSTYVISSDQRAYKWMLANDSSVGAYGFHYRDAATGRPLRITDHPYVTIVNRSHAKGYGGAYQRDLLPACSANCKTPYQFETAHHPSIGYVSYLVTGDYYYLEELQFTASFIELSASEGYRELDKGRLLRASPQVRGQAWSVRSIADAAFATPDADPMKAYFVDQIAYIIADYNTQYTDNAAESPMHVLDKFGAVHYGVNGKSNNGIAPWQQDFFTWAVGHAAEQGVPGASKLLRWLAVFPIARMTDSTRDSDSGFCWIEAAAYSMQVTDSSGGATYGDISSLYKATFPKLYGLACNGQPFFNALNASGGKYQTGEMTGYANSPTGFPSNMQIGLAMAADTDVSNAANAWRVFDSRSIKPGYGNYANFAVVPRTIN